MLFSIRSMGKPFSEKQRHLDARLAPGTQFASEPRMRLKRLTLREGFRVVRGNPRSQAAEMVIAPGEAEGDPRNRHRGADQWLYVVAGTGSALVKGKRYEGTQMNTRRQDLSYKR
jgi:mannose-6-phosphate isomerase-like protein (cupin superfamily)